MTVEAHVLVRSRFSFQETVARLAEAITGAGQTTFATIDQAKAASEAGLSLRPTILIVFGNPKGGTPLMQGFPLVGLDLPLKLLVSEDESGVSVAYVSMSEIARRWGVTGYDAPVAAADRVLESLAASVA